MWKGPRSRTIVPNVLRRSAFSIMNPVARSSAQGVACRDALAPVLGGSVPSRGSRDKYTWTQVCQGCSRGSCWATDVSAPGGHEVCKNFVTEYVKSYEKAGSALY